VLNEETVPVARKAGLDFRRAHRHHRQDQRKRSGHKICLTSGRSTARDRLHDSRGIPRIRPGPAERSTGTSRS
jgi:hypothetical protein